MVETRASEAPMAVYARHLAQGRLAYQYSRAAGRPFFYPRIVCPYSGSDDFEWRVSSGRGTLYAKTAFYPRHSPGYAVVLVDLDEGFRMMSRVMDAPPEAVHIGARVRLSIRPAENGDPAPFFVLDEPAQGPAR